MFPSVAHREVRLSQCVKRVKKKSTSVATSNTRAPQPETSFELAHLRGCRVELRVELGVRPHDGSGADGIGFRF